MSEHHLVITIKELFAELRKEEHMDLTALETQLNEALTAVNAALASVQSAPAEGAPDPNDALVQELVASLVSAGYTVTPPAQAEPVDGADGSDSAPTE